MTTKEYNRAENIRKFTSLGHRIGLTDLTRSKGWRDDLTAYDIMEVVDRNDTTAYLVSLEGMRALMDEIDSLEEEIERMQIDMLFAKRQQMNDWSSGKSLATKAKAHLDSKEEVK
jgi:hypothetical protein